MSFYSSHSLIGVLQLKEPCGLGPPEHSMIEHDFLTPLHLCLQSKTDPKNPALAVFGDAYCVKAEGKNPSTHENSPVVPHLCSVTPPPISKIGTTWNEDSTHHYSTLSE